MSVGARQPESERGAAPVRHHMALRARFAAIRRVRSGSAPPFFAGMLALSRQARSQSIWSASPSSSNKTWCRRSQTPASCQSCNRRQQVMPEPQPISAGSISQGMPALSTKMMPVRQARSGMRGRPPVGFAGSGGSNGAMRFQSSSETNGLLISHGIASRIPWFC